MKTTLRSILDVDQSDFGLGELEYQMLVRAYNNEEEVEVLEIACEGGTLLHSYFDIKLSNGLVLDAIAGTHLVNISDFGPEKVLHCQLVIDVQYFNKRNAVVDTSILEDLISQATYNAIRECSATTLRLRQIEVTHETNFTSAPD